MIIHIYVLLALGSFSQLGIPKITKKERTRERNDSKERGRNEREDIYKGNIMLSFLTRKYPVAPFHHNCGHPLPYILRIPPVPLLPPQVRIISRP
jgi:hypothetical protein